MSFQRRGKAIETGQTMMAILFPARKLIVLNILPKESKFNPRSFVDDIFPNFAKGKREFSSSHLAGDFLRTHGQFMCHNGPKVASKFAKHHISGLPHPPDSPDISPCGFGSLECWKKS
jgi:hypothetical protein